MRIFLFFFTQNQTQISSITRRIQKMSIPKLSKEMLKYVSDKQPYSVQSIRYMAVNDVEFCLCCFRACFVEYLWFFLQQSCQ